MAPELLRQALSFDGATQLVERVDSAVYLTESWFLDMMSVQLDV